MIFGKQASVCGQFYLSLSVNEMLRIRTFPVRAVISSEPPWMTIMSHLQYVFFSFIHNNYQQIRHHQLLEVQAQHAFIRDEQSKGRWDAALTRSLFSFMMEVFDRTVGRDLGPKVNEGGESVHVC
jgi:hypothetical protein